MYSRLDHFLLSAPLLPNVLASEINPITLDLNIFTALPKTCHWRLNESLLRNIEFKDQLQLKLTEYFQLNEGSVPDTSILWEAHKAFFRGECISAGSRMKQDSIKNDRSF